MNEKTPDESAKAFLVEASQLANDIDAMRQKLFGICNSGIESKLFDRICNVEELLRRGSRSLSYIAFDSAAAIRNANASPPSAISANTTPDVDNTNEQ